MKLLVYISHPAQFHFFRNPVERLRNSGHEVIIVIKHKDVLKDLLDEAGLNYHIIRQHRQQKSLFSFSRNILIRDYFVYNLARKLKPNLLVGTDASLAHAGFLLGIPCITTLEDDYKVIKKLASITYPFTTKILAPARCDTGRWRIKQVAYEGFMKLSYLHPAVFTPDRMKVICPPEIPYFVIRLSGLLAHHDSGIRGINNLILDKIIERLKPHGKIFITSEKFLPDRYQKYKLQASPSDIHHYLAFTDLLISDSQSMSVEAAMLGTPNLRISGFKGRISVLEELENEYGLTIGVLPREHKKILDSIEFIVNNSNIKKEYQQRRRRMLGEKIDVASFVVWFLENYPESFKILEKDPDFGKRFIKLMT